MAWRENAAFGNVSINKLWDISMSVGTEGTNTVTTAITITNAVSGGSPGRAMAFPFYISSDSAGQVLEAGSDLAITAGTDGLVILSGGDSKVYGHFVTETTGEMDFIVTDTGTDAYYLNVIMPDGRVETSTVMTLTA